ncbi:MAG: hypothetical protein AB1925_22645 [Actinomycetota bacterium]
MPKRTNDFQQIIAMVVELLEDGAVVEESVLFEDPDTGVMREVDVYALVKGKMNGQDFAIAVECVDRSRKMDTTWVEMIYGKHSRLQVANAVLLVSARGFYHSAEVKARKLGYKTISPSISKQRLAKTIFGTDGGPRMGMSIGLLSLVGVQIVASAPRLNADFRLAEPDVNTCEYQSADGTPLIRANEFAMQAALENARQTFGAFMAEQASDETTTFTVDEPTFNGHRLYVTMRSPDGSVELLALLDRLEITVKVAATGMTEHTLTEGGDFGGNDFATGAGQIGNYPSRFTVVSAPDGTQRGMLRTQYYIPGDDAES